jgi:hypothetical protein
LYAHPKPLFTELFCQGEQSRSGNFNLIETGLVKKHARLERAYGIRRNLAKQIESEQN